jgi:hypothetical protein
LQTAILGGFLIVFGERGSQRTPPMLSDIDTLDSSPPLNKMKDENNESDHEKEVN